MTELPLYYRVFVSLRHKIFSGAFGPQQPMPSEQKLCVEYGISRGTLRRALELLEDDGIVVRQQGAKTYVKALGYKASRQPRNLERVARKSNHEELFAGQVDQFYSVVAADKELLRQFSNQPKLGRIARIRKAGDRPYCFVISYLPLTIAQRIDWQTLGTKPVITAVVNAGYDFVKTEQVIAATVANAESAAALQAPLGSPLLLVRGLFVDKDGNSVMRKDGYFQPDSFEYRMTIYKQNKEG